MVGFPGERAAAIDDTFAFLQAHEGCFDRVRLSRFKAIPGTRFATMLRSRPERFAGISNFSWNHRYARASYRYDESLRSDYRKSKARLLTLVHQINRKRLRPGAEI